MDPGAIGTTIIGLEAVRAREERAERRPSAGHRQARLDALRLAWETALRRLADLAEPDRHSASGRL
jgi:hypothetical protein